MSKITQSQAIELNIETTFDTANETMTHDFGAGKVVKVDFKKRTITVSENEKTKYRIMFHSEYSLFSYEQLLISVANGTLKTDQEHE